MRDRGHVGTTQATPGFDQTRYYGEKQHSLQSCFTNTRETFACRLTSPKLVGDSTKIIIVQRLRGTREIYKLQTFSEKKLFFKITVNFCCFFVCSHGRDGLTIAYT